MLHTPLSPRSSNSTTEIIHYISSVCGSTGSITTRQSVEMVVHQGLDVRYSVGPRNEWRGERSVERCSGVAEKRDSWSELRMLGRRPGRQVNFRIRAARASSFAERCRIFRVAVHFRFRLRTQRVLLFDCVWRRRLGTVDIGGLSIPPGILARDLRTNVTSRTIHSIRRHCVRPLQLSVSKLVARSQICL
ncbi:hypothetical protein BDV93DRAFT_324294 [Ceratobasidium sp. AG-I]|nr:hypothetical protein BDV93DRAFT_324294 [Ceratobasidium sp. AG-I]